MYNHVNSVAIYPSNLGLPLYGSHWLSYPQTSSVLPPCAGGHRSRKTIDNNEIQLSVNKSTTRLLAHCIRSCTDKNLERKIAGKITCIRTCSSERGNSHEVRSARPTLALGRYMPVGVDCEHYSLRMQLLLSKAHGLISNIIGATNRMFHVGLKRGARDVRRLKVTHGILSGSSYRIGQGSLLNSKLLV